MAETFFFYDLETSGINPREQRIMQFAGQRTNLDLDPIDEPINVLIRLTDDILPDPDAILVTKITPQQTLSEGITEAEFLKIFHEQIATQGTVFVGYNTVRFDDEFMRYLHYRNYYDPYEWHWKDDKSRWDLLDVVRMTRALRPQGIEWPVSIDGKPTNRLELLTSLNKISHQKAHDALNDVNATIALAKLLRICQPKLFDYLLKMRNKVEVEKLVKSNKPFVYTSGKYSNDSEKTAVVIFFADNPKSGALVYDLSIDPKPWLNLAPEQLAEAWKWNPDNSEPRLPIKTLQFNRCPAVAPYTVLDDDSKNRIKINDQTISDNLACLKANHDFEINVLKALSILNNQQQTAWQKDKKLVDAQLYDGFFDNTDKQKMQEVSNFNKNEISKLQPNFKDARLNLLLPLFKARNYPELMNEDDHIKWNNFRFDKFYQGGEESRASNFFKRLDYLAQQPGLDKEKQYLLDELKLFAESILPEVS